MAGPGRPPKDPDKRVRRNKEHRSTLAGGPSGARPIPQPPPDGWHPATIRWWEVWSSSPQAAKFTAPAWNRLETLAPIVETFWRTGSLEAMREIRLNESLLGATPMDLSRLKWDLADDKAPEPTASPDELTKWRSRKRVVDGTG